VKVWKNNAFMLSQLQAGVKVFRPRNLALISFAYVRIARVISPSFGSLAFSSFLGIISLRHVEILSEEVCVFGSRKGEEIQSCGKRISFHGFPS
jgi:hypothetical protein